MPLHRFASLPNYAHHIEPVWQALPEELRGESWAPVGRPWGIPLRVPSRTPPGPVLVASFADARAMSRRDLVLVDHGAGQHYPGDPRAFDNGSYAGGGGLDSVRLFLTPSERVADRWRASYPGVPAVAVGCPRLDVLRRARPPRGKGPVVVITWHWDCALCPETQSALRHYWRGLEPLRDALRALGGELWGSAHPRAWSALERLYGHLGIHAVRDIDEVLGAADVLVFDNTSAGLEAASLDIPVVVLDAPWYRKNVTHGGRFWDWADVGVRISEPDQLVPAVLEALMDPPEVANRRRDVALDVYAYQDDRASERAAAAIVDVLGPVA